MEIRPDFYDRFRCLAGGCRHSCCRQGWEIDVDPDTLQLYRELQGPLGEALRAALREENGCWSIRLDETGTCPLLRPDGLCRVVAELGEDGLCDICALHPRFYGDAGGHELAGVGLCCEQAAALLLGDPGRLRFLTEDGGALTLDGLLRLLGQSPAPEALRYVPRTDPAYFREIFRRYARCEAIDENWTRDLAVLAADPEGAAARAEDFARRRDPALFQRVFDYILYRQLELLERYSLDALIRYAREAADFVLLWAASAGDLPERLRMWSAEMEYSTENVGLLLEGLVRGPEEPAR